MPRTSQSAGARSPHLDSDEQGQAADHAPLPALVIHELVRDEGEAALERKAGSMWWSALAAGMSMGFSFLTEAMLRSALPDTSWRSLISGAGYCVGFVIVILGRQQLFTESTLTALLPLLTRKNLPTLMAVLRLWSIVLLANLSGTLVFALALSAHGVFAPAVVTALHELATQALQGSFWSMGLRAVLAGWLIALMVWVLPSAKAERLSTVVLITYVVAISHLSHIIAGSVEVFYAVIVGAATLSDYFFKFMAPTLLGNVIGGISLVAFLNHGAVAAEMRSDLEPEGPRPHPEADEPDEDEPNKHTQREDARSREAS
jgi:formate/nitrite transporter FocA (FNT family)